MEIGNCFFIKNYQEINSKNTFRISGLYQICECPRGYYESF